MFIIYLTLKLCKGANVKLLGFRFFWVEKKKIGTFLGTQTKKRIWHSYFDIQIYLKFKLIIYLNKKKWYIRENPNPLLLTSFNYQNSKINSKEIALLQHVQPLLSVIKN